MSVLVNGVQVTATDRTTSEFAAARELLRQRAIAIGVLTPDATDATEIESGLEELLTREVSTPEPTEEECLRYYEAHPQEFRSGDLVHARHILFQVTPAVPIPEIRARAEQTLNGLLRESDRFEAVAREMSNCPSGQQGGNLGQIGRGDTVPEFERRCSGLDRLACCANWSRHVTGSTSWRSTSAFRAKRCLLMSSIARSQIDCARM